MGHVVFDESAEWRSGWLARFRGEPRECPFDANVQLVAAEKWCKGYDDANEALVGAPLRDVVEAPDCAAATL